MLITNVTCTGEFLADVHCAGWFVASRVQVCLIVIVFAALQGWSRPEVAAAAAHTAGQPISNKSQYNIITGGPPMTNFVFESWDAKHDYRKTR